jgi:bile acid:Na+ symporter, BASS family
MFLSFLSIKIPEIWKIVRKSAPALGYLTILKMLVLPVCISLLFRLFWPTYSLSALLLSGISTGVIAPFVSNLVGANSPLVIVMVVITSLIVPFTLPPLVNVLFGRSMEISLFSMMYLLSMVVFIPVILAVLVQRISPRITEVLTSKQYYIGLVLFAITNLGIFSKYSEYFYQKPMMIAAAALASFILGGLYLFLGLLVSWGKRLEDRLTAVISLGIMNNVLVIVFSSQFFTPLEPTVAAMYMIPFFGLIIPLRAYRSWKTKTLEPS